MRVDMGGGHTFGKGGLREPPLAMGLDQLVLLNSFMRESE